MKQKKLLIIGAGEAAELLLQEIKKNPLLHFWVEGFVDDFKKKNSTIQNIPVLGNIDQIPTIVKEKSIEAIIIAIPSLPEERLRQIVTTCKKTSAEVRIMPSTYESLYTLETGRPWYKEIRNVKLEDLLRRKPVIINPREIKQYVSGKTILVTGGGGSIGSELCHQISELQPKKLIILDNSEYNLYTIDRTLREKYGTTIDFRSLTIDVKDKKALERTFRQHKIDIVFHAAAYKHVPLMETNIIEAVKNNVLGTFNVASTAEQFNVDHFVMISTDKAVNPTSVMGTTKLISEMLVQLFNKKTSFVIVRFGNVLGSKGSVIPLFEEQIKKGGPITITHPEIKRYFMTIPEAAQLVIQAGAIGEDKQILVLDMGKQYKIVDIAKDLVKLYGLKPHKDIAFKYIGLRPGEKLYEELLTKKESLQKTKHKRIFLAQSELIHRQKLTTFLATIQKMISEGNEPALKKELSTFISNYTPKENKSAFNKTEELRNKRILITGSTGFIGNHLRKKLDKLKISYKEASRTQGIDLCDQTAINHLPPADIVIHLAGEIPQNKNPDFKKNITMTKNILSYCKKHNARLVLASSVAVYGPQKKETILTEETKPQPTGDYALSKYHCETLFKKSGVKGTILRLFNTYGPGQKQPFVIPSIAQGIRKGTITIDKSISRDFVYVTDVVNSIIHTSQLETDSVETINIGSGTANSLETVAQTMKKHTDNKNITLQNKPGPRNAIKTTTADITKAKTLLGWKPHISLEEGLRLTLQDKFK